MDEDSKIDFVSGTNLLDIATIRTLTSPSSRPAEWTGSTLARVITPARTNVSISDSFFSQTPWINYGRIFFPDNANAQFMFSPGFINHGLIEVRTKRM